MEPLPIALLRWTFTLGASFIGWLIVGLLAGWLAGLVVRGRGYGCCADIVLGWVGAVVGGILISALFGQSIGGFIGSLFVAFIGAMIVLLLARLVFGSSHD